MFAGALKLSAYCTAAVNPVGGFGALTEVLPKTKAPMSNAPVSNRVAPSKSVEATHGAKPPGAQVLPPAAMAGVLGLRW